MNGWTISATIMVPIIVTAIIAIIATKRSDKKLTELTASANQALIESTGKIIEDARNSGVNCIEKSVNAVSLEIKELGNATVKAIEANGKSITEASLKVIETQTSGLVKAIEALARK